MRAVVVEEPGGPEVLKLRDDLAQPQPGNKEICIEVAYAGMNFMDVLGRSGRYVRGIKYPWIPGGEVSGVVGSIGSDVNHLQPGQHVCALTGTSGGYAEYAVAHEDAVYPLPTGMSFQLAAAYPLQVLTAWGVLNVSARPRAGEWVLIHAAAGGVGLILCQLARAKCCNVIGTAGTAEKCQHAMDHGAQWVINYNDELFHKRVMEITNGHGADWILDSVGKATQSGNQRCLARFGRVVVYGYASGEPKYNMRVLWGRSAGVTTYGLYHHMEDWQLTKRSIKETLVDVMDGTLKLHLGGTYKLADVQEAHRLLEGRQSTGKLLLEI
jgi:NADPH2:quinone reductase